MGLLGLAGPAAGETDAERVERVVYNQLEVSAAHESRYLSGKLLLPILVLRRNSPIGSQRHIGRT